IKKRKQILFFLLFLKGCFEKKGLCFGYLPKYLLICIKILNNAKVNTINDEKNNYYTFTHGFSFNSYGTNNKATTP
ncbi:MAG: hypothetical protein Q4D12_07920, partial [Bacteroidales bacterium]|nr:hypothetical protein [Bacteroidales bacterium]